MQKKININRKSAKKKCKKRNMNRKGAKKSSNKFRKKHGRKKCKKKLAENTEQYHCTCNLGIFRYFWIL